LVVMTPRVTDAPLTRRSQSFVMISVFHDVSRFSEPPGTTERVRGTGGATDHRRVRHGVEPATRRYSGTSQDRVDLAVVVACLPP
jgi:hypothetical protein